MFKFNPLNIFMAAAAYQLASWARIIILKIKKWPILSLLSLNFILEALGFNINKWISYLSTAVVIKWILYIGSIGVFLLMIDSMLNLLLFYLLSKKKITISELQPSLLYNRLKSLEIISQSSNLSKRYFINLELKHLLIYVVVLIINIISYMIL